ncbi:MAG: potassium-transporting ATPase subunit KdpA [Proteobacteria bacterium]|nr:MAG: potassium-transporting ATPase subunit KdpA [Pseudomonadota bacterium]
MTANGWLQIALFVAVLFLVTKPFGVFLFRVFERQRTFLDPLLRPIERLLYRISGVDETREMRWTEYGIAMLLFSGVSMILLYLIERMQLWLPLNPQKLANVAPTLAWNTAASFTTNTNWQAYTPETTMSYLTQMAGLAYHNFASAATGIALAVALVRGVARKEANTIGNFWVDLTRCFLWVLLPACLLIALVLVSQGAVQTLHPYAVVQVLDPQTVQSQTADGKTATKTIAQQTIALGPTASQEAIKMFGTNGGGFFNANSAHPFENPTPFTNFLQLLLIFAIPSALTYTLGRYTRSQRHGWAVWAAMLLLFLAATMTAYWAESRGNPLWRGVDQTASERQPGGNMEGKEVRFGITNSSLFAAVTTDASCGAVNSWHDSFTPLGGMVLLVNILLGEVVFGGVGSGLYGMLVFVILAVFLAGLMVGRTPEYLGKKIEAYDVKMAALSVLIFPVTVLVLSAIAAVSNFGTASITNAGPHGLTQMLYAYASATGNNGSAFAGLSVNTNWYNNSTGLATLLGRFFAVIPILAIAGNLARKKSTPESAGTFPVTTPLFTTLLVSTVLIVGALTFFPVLSLGPVLEHLLLFSGKVF